MLLNVSKCKGYSVIAFIVSELLRENQNGGIKITLPIPCPTNEIRVNIGSISNISNKKMISPKIKLKFHQGANTAKALIEVMRNYTMLYHGEWIYITLMEK